MLVDESNKNSDFLSDIVKRSSYLKNMGKSQYSNKALKWLYEPANGFEEEQEELEAEEEEETVSTIEIQISQPIVEVFIPKPPIIPVIECVPLPEEEPNKIEHMFASMKDFFAEKFNTNKEVQEENGVDSVEGQESLSNSSIDDDWSMVDKEMTSQYIVDYGDKIEILTEDREKHFLPEQQQSSLVDEPEFAAKEIQNQLADYIKKMYNNMV